MKYLTIAVLGLLGLTVLILGVVLVPAHLQIRAIDVDIPPLNEIANLRVDEIERPQAVTFVTTAQQSSEPGKMGHVGVLITWINGRQLLIDTGMDLEAAVEFGKLIELMLGADPMKTFGPIEEQLEDSVDDIDAIVFTHLHSDHTQGVTGLCNAMTDPARVFQTLTTCVKSYKNCNGLSHGEGIRLLLSGRPSDRLFAYIGCLPGLRTVMPQVVRVKSTPTVRSAVVY